MNASSQRRRVLVTGGAGFIGTNVADRLLSTGHDVVVLDNMSRPGVEHNLAWLREQHPQVTVPGRQLAGALTVSHGDVRDTGAVRAALVDCTHVFHLAAQTAVTSSVDDPRHDFTVNLGGTLNLLEEARRRPNPPSLLFTSTNKVYGAMEGMEIIDTGGRYGPADPAWHANGISEEHPLDFCSPYGCSKGGADQYVLDYAKSYGLRTVVFRMSCIYGQHQQGNEDQGWVAHFLRQALAGNPITLYGDGLQVRDILHVDDLVDAMLRATADIDRLAGRAFNIGGGPPNAVSLLELTEMIDRLNGRRTDVEFADWRVGDQRWYVSDTRRFTRATGWSATVPAGAGVERLFGWLRAHDHLAVAEAR